MKTKSLFTRLSASSGRIHAGSGLASRLSPGAPVLIAVLGLLAGGRVAAQTFTTLHSFPASGTNSSGIYTNSDGANPYGGLTMPGSGNTRYGIAANGGTAGYGTVFAINADGTGLTILHAFNNTDGANPWTGLVLSGNTLFGTANYGGSAGEGALFAVNTDGTGFRILHTFTGGLDGAYPNGGLILQGNTLYGTAAHGGSADQGTVFAINTDGTGFTVLHDFTAVWLQTLYGYDYYHGEYYIEFLINPDGAVPAAGLILTGNTLYGTATGGGYGGNGTVFAVNTDGTGFTTLHSFQQTENLTRHPARGGGFGGGGGGGMGGGGCYGGGCGAGSQCVGGFCGCSGFCMGG